MADRPVGLRDVLLLAAACVVVVLGAAVVTSFLPTGAQAVVFRTPLLIVVLIVGTAAALWRIARPRAGATVKVDGAGATAAEHPVPDDDHEEPPIG